MEESQQAITRVVNRMYNEFFEELTIDDLAETAFYSKFHFTRVFQKFTGMTPARFLSAVRIYKAKELLLNSSLTVTEISHGVGYASCGTFSTRFSQSVGTSPSTYRQSGGVRPHPDVQLGAEPTPKRSDGTNESSIHGRIAPWTVNHKGPTFVGVFPTPLLERDPVASVVVDAPATFAFDNLPSGPLFVLACSQDLQRPPRLRHAPLLTASSGLIEQRPGITSVVDLVLSPPVTLEPPVLLAQPEPENSSPQAALRESYALEKVGQL